MSDPAENKNDVIRLAVNRPDPEEEDDFDGIELSQGDHIRYGKLSVMQMAFVKAYLSDPELNAERAALRAGYSKRSAKNASYALLNHPAIREAIDESMAARAEQLEMTPEWVMLRLKEEATREDKAASHTARVKALHLVGQHMGMFAQNLNITEEQTLIKITKKGPPRKRKSKETKDE